MLTEIYSTPRIPDTDDEEDEEEGVDKKANLPPPITRK
jgi:hypothetical protein